ncbi:50S ribosome-binding GTPase [Methylomonas sp. EFPC3]|uniref:GTPase n=1 Tax=Methylomonas sp. EFPC3 TaxID=3021710 RepID=UPI00241763D7|nr:GTPase [Methylomonas sp. EFPC3]WFP49303.1 50S ribosome-binding GTPase [Methylomonas sp. EFPC3]
MNPSDEITKQLEVAAKAAKRALDHARPGQKDFLTALQHFEKQIGAAQVIAPTNANPIIREATETFSQRYNDLRGKLDGLSAKFADSLSKSLENFERDASYVTLMLFGRTRAGKSTTMEALTGGDGSTIGIGMQHTTREVRAYYFPSTDGKSPPDRPALRIVDTPGIEGFEGEALGEMAEEFIDRADHILFMLTDDKATDGELERFRTIRTQGKGVTVLLNVKTADEDLDLLIGRPELIFKADELDGHSRRICGQLERRLSMPKPRLIHIHSRAAWLGRSDAGLPEGLEEDDRHALVSNSRICDLEHRITEFIQTEALPARLAGPRTLLLSHLWPLKDMLRPFAGEFRQMMDTLEQLGKRLEISALEAQKKSVRRLPLIRSRFQAASDAIPGMIDEVIAAGGRGHALNTHWKQLLNTHAVLDAGTWFTEIAQQDFKSEFSEEMRSSTFDFQFVKVDDFDELLDDYHKLENDQRRNKYARIGLRTAGGTGAAALATWAVANWWNPTGWIAAVVVAGAGFTGEALARSVADDLDSSDKRALHEKRTAIIAKLNERIWNDHHRVHMACENWLDQTKALYIDTANQVMAPIHCAARDLWRSIVASLKHLDEVSDSINKGLIVDLFNALIPESTGGDVYVDSVARIPDYRTKVVIRTKPDQHKNVLAVCIGHKGERIRRIASAIGGERIDLVDGDADDEVRVLQALGLHNIHNACIKLSIQSGRRAAIVRFDREDQVAAAIGPKGANVRLARKLLGMDIVIENGK